MPETEKKIALNLMWIHNRHHSDDGTGYPLSHFTSNILKIAEDNRNAELLFWVDSKEVEENPDYKNALDKMLKRLRKEKIEVTSCDLRKIPEYVTIAEKTEPLEEKSPPDIHESPFWQRVDAAKVLVCRQCFSEEGVEEVNAKNGNKRSEKSFQTVFFSDVDIKDLVTASFADVLSRKGFLMGAMDCDGVLTLENQVWGFDKKESGFFSQVCQEIHNLFEGSVWQEGDENVFEIFITAAEALCEAKGIPLNFESKDLYIPQYWRPGTGLDEAEIDESKDRGMRK